MAAFSASDAAFEGFRITRERPLAVAIWVGLYIAYQAALLVLVMPRMASFMSVIQQQTQSGATADPTAVLNAYSEVAPAYAILMPIALIVNALMQCAVYRSVIRPQDRGFGFLKLSGDELRVLAVQIAISLLLGVGVFVGLLLATAVGAGVAAASQPVGVLVGAALLAAVICAFTFVAVRLSLAPVMTFAERDFRVFESWTATRGLFWPLLGAYLLAFVMGLLVTILVSIVSAMATFAVAAATGTAQTAAQGNFDPALLTSPPVITGVLFQGVISALFSIILLAPAAAVWMRLRGQGRAFD